MFDFFAAGKSLFGGYNSYPGLYQNPAGAGISPAKIAELKQIAESASGIVKGVQEAFKAPATTY